jgi:DNA-directed RNA polymerase III subunit RPC2
MKERNQSGGWRVSTTSGSPAKFKSQSCSYKAPAPSVVDRVLLTANETDQFLVKVMVRQSRRPEIGDKLATGARKKNKQGLS